MIKKLTDNFETTNKAMVKKKKKTWSSGKQQSNLIYYKLLEADKPPTYFYSFIELRKQGVPFCPYRKLSQWIIKNQVEQYVRVILKTASSSQWRTP